MSVLGQDCSGVTSPATRTGLIASLSRQGTSKVGLAWTGGASSIDVYRQKPGGASVRIGTTSNNGTYRDSLGKRPTPGTYTYRPCSAGTTVCSADVPMTVSRSLGRAIGGPSTALRSADGPG